MQFKILPVLGVLFLTVSFANGQGKTQMAKPEIIKPEFKKTEKLLDILNHPKTFKARQVRDENGLIGIKKVPFTHNFFGNYNSGMPDPLYRRDMINGLQSPNSITSSATIGQSFDGIGYQLVSPADPVCTVGSNHVIQMVNALEGALVKIFDKTGAVVVNSFLMSDITGVQGAGDPVILYDAAAKRWILNEFGYSGGVNYINTIIFAVSATDDPLGSWYVYTYVNNFFTDYQKVGIWGDAYYATCNNFTSTPPTTYTGSSAYAFDRTKMLSGDPSASGIRFILTDPGDSRNRYYGMAPVCQEGKGASSQHGLFALYQNDSWSSDPLDKDSLVTFELTPDFTTPANSTFSFLTNLELSPLDEFFASGGNAITQQGSATKLATLAYRLMNRVVYRKFSTYESILLSFTVNADGLGMAGIRWTELRRSGGNWSVYQEGTHTSGTNNAWMGTITQDEIGNIGLVYNVAGATAFPSIRFTGRNPCDPLGLMTLTEQVIINGSASQSGSRYGDYNMVSIDPSTGLDFWCTAMYNATSSASTRLASFNFNNCTPLPLVKFDVANLTVKESDANITLGCLKYKDYTTNVVIDVAPSANATINFTLAGSASANQDYQLLTPSVILKPGVLIQPVNIRVFDDAAIEGTEDISLSYSITTAGNATANTYNQVCTITIIDNDNAPIVSSTGVASWGAPTNTSNTLGMFGGASATDKRIQHMYKAADMVAAGLKAGFITDFSWFIYGIAIFTFNNLNLSIGFTTATTLASGFVVPTGLTSFYSGNFTTPGARGFYNYVLPTPVYWNGTDNIIIEGCFDNTALSGDVSVLGTIAAGYSATTVVNQNVAGAGNSACASAAVSISGFRPDIRLKMRYTINPVATVLNTSKTANLGPNEDVAFYDASGNVMARIKNLTSFDYGCTTVQIDRAGTNSSQFWNTNTANYLMDKSFKVIPTNNTTSGSYEITLYYIQPEVTGWQTATLQSFSNAQIAKVSDGFYVPDITAATPHASSIIVAPATQGAFGTDYTIKSTFTNTGFSGFGLGVPAAPIPVTLVNFAAIDKNGFGLLIWSTENETNNKGFDIEKSYDGISYFKLGFVAGAGNSSLHRNYVFPDPARLTSVQYFRLKQVDVDGRSTYSNIAVLKRTARLPLDVISVTNPFRDNVSIVFTENPQTQVKFELLDAAGQRVFAGSQMINNVNAQLQLPSTIAAGNYLLKISVNDQSFSKKLIKQ
ncbi:hypothetical protein BH09BAC2_BH09BAC2_01320 [soil metagenome]